MASISGYQSIPVLSDYFSKLTPSSPILKAECEFIVMSVFVYTSSKVICAENSDLKELNSLQSAGIHVELMLTDGIHFRKVYIKPIANLDHSVFMGKLIAGSRVKLKLCSWNSGAKNSGRDFIAVDEIEIVSDSTYGVAQIPDMGKLQPDPRFATRRQYTQYFIPILEDKMTFFNIWLNNVPRWPPEKILPHAQIMDETVVEIATKGPYLKDLYYEHAIRPYPVRPLVLRVIAKGNVYQVTSRDRPSCPFLSVHRVMDASGICKMTLFYETNILNNSIREGTLLCVSDYYVKMEKNRDPAKLYEIDKLMDAKVDYAVTYPMDILIKPSILKNQSHVTAIPMKIIDGSLRERITAHVPMPQYKFINAVMFNSSDLDLVDIVGVVVGISRYDRIRQENNQLYVSRWIEIACIDVFPTVIPINFLITQQVKEHMNMKLGDFVVITNLKCMQWDDTKRYLEATVMSQIIFSSKKSYTLLSKHDEYNRAFAISSKQGYIDVLLEKCGWLGGTYNLVNPQDCRCEQFPPITHCEQWKNEIFSLAYGEVKQLSIRSEIVKVVLWTVDGFGQELGNGNYISHEIYKSSGWKTSSTEYYGTELPHVNTFPVYYDAKTYFRKLSEMQFPPMDLDEWFAKEERMKHPNFREHLVPKVVPVHFLSVWLQSQSNSEQMFICCFPISPHMENIENVKLKQLLSLETGQRCYGSKLVNATKLSQWTKSMSENLCHSLTSNIGRNFKEEVICLLEIRRIGAEPQPEVVLRKVYWEEDPVVCMT